MAEPAPAPAKVRAPEPTPKAEPAAAPPAPVMAAPSGAPSRPEALSGPRGGKADDLKLIVGIGPKLEKLCHTLGFYHFDQIAKWTASEVGWVDENLEGFKGRVTRDKWVAQAKVLASGGSVADAERVHKG
jgi:predicted flap endonuclease-1-like 5' DNA nuclease